MNAFYNQESNDSHNNEKSEISTCKCIFFLRDLFLFDEADTSQGERRTLGAPQGSEHPEEGAAASCGGWGVGLALGSGCLFNLLLEVFLLFTFINLSLGFRASPPSHLPSPAPPPPISFLKSELARQVCPPSSHSSNK